MSDFDKSISELGKTEKVQETKDVPIIQYEPLISTVANLISEDGVPPPSIESRGGDMAITVTQVESSSDLTNDWPNMIKDIQDKLDQLKQNSDSLSGEETKKDFQDILGKISDIDGDGIPDDYDKNPGETTANVAARINKIGRYAVTEDSKMKIFSAVKSITKSLDSLLNKISAMSAASSLFQQPQKMSAPEILDGDENPFSSKKVDKDYK
ncbi:MAG: hypothetical protein LBQ23_01855 [Puniceicoccales bacterium]|jgi:hypothetical protein|nr:hypothetical protein [Puniceicoccales bacterium]